MTQMQFKPTMIDTSSLIRRMLAGAVIALAVISVFIFPVDDPKPEWGKYWMIRPLIIVPLAGAMGGMISYFMSYFSKAGYLNKILAVVVSVVVFVVGLWLGIVLGLDGTMWD